MDGLGTFPEIEGVLVVVSYVEDILEAVSFTEDRLGFLFNGNKLDAF